MYFNFWLVIIRKLMQFSRWNFHRYTPHFTFANVKLGYSSQYYHPKSVIFTHALRNIKFVTIKNFISIFVPLSLNRLLLVNFCCRWKFWVERGSWLLYLCFSFSVFFFWLLLMNSNRNNLPKNGKSLNRSMIIGKH